MVGWIGGTLLAFGAAAWVGIAVIMYELSKYTIRWVMSQRKNPVCATHYTPA